MGHSPSLLSRAGPCEDLPMTQELAAGNWSYVIVVADRRFGRRAIRGQWEARPGLMPRCRTCRARRCDGGSRGAALSPTTCAAPGSCAALALQDVVARVLD